MIVTLSHNSRIASIGQNQWHVLELANPTRGMFDLPAAFELALTFRHATPGTPLDLAAFNCALREAAGRFAHARKILFAEGYKAALTESGEAWQLFEDKERGGEHRVPIGQPAPLLDVLTRAAWHLALHDQRFSMTVAEVGPLMAAIAGRLLAGATFFTQPQATLATAEGIP